MKLTKLSTNAHLVSHGDRHILFSYETAVAYYKDDTLYQWNDITKTSKKHVNQAFNRMEKTELSTLKFKEGLNQVFL